MHNSLLLAAIVVCAGCQPPTLPAAVEPMPATATLPAGSASNLASAPPAPPAESAPAISSSSPLLPESAVASAAPVHAPGLAPIYFPTDSVSDSASTWYSKHLRIMGEKPLLEITRPGEQSYRFLWLRTIGRPVVVRIMHSESGTELFVVRLSGHGGSATPGNVELSGQKTLTKKDWRSIQGLLTLAHYDTIQPVLFEDMLGSDGSQWIMESVRDGKYRLVQRWTPRATGRDPGFRWLCEKFLALAGPGVVTGSMY